MKTARHNQWNIEHPVVEEFDAALMSPDIVASEMNRLYRRMAEAEFLLALHGEGMIFPEELKYTWPTEDYRVEDR